MLITPISYHPPGNNPNRGLQARRCRSADGGGRSGGTCTPAPQPLPSTPKPSPPSPSNPQAGTVLLAMQVRSRHLQAATDRLEAEMRLPNAKLRRCAQNDPPPYIQP